MGNYKSGNVILEIYFKIMFTVFWAHYSYNKDFLLSDNYDHSTFKVHDFPFVFHTVDACREILSASGMKIIEEIAVDGLSELLADQINNMSDEDYNQWLRYHFYYCNKPEFFGASNHLLFICEI